MVLGQRRKAAAISWAADNTESTLAMSQTAFNKRIYSGALPTQSRGHGTRFAQVSCLRAGITLLEVLIATGVLSIGLLAIASLIPVGKYQLSQAVKMDRSSNLGRAAFRTLPVAEWLRPDMWLYANNQPVLKNNRFQLMMGQYPPPMVPVVLDPLMIGVNTPPSLGATGNGLQLVQTFPYGLQSGGAGTPENSAPVIPRITLRESTTPYLGGAGHGDAGQAHAGRRRRSVISRLGRPGFQHHRYQSKRHLGIDRQRHSGHDRHWQRQLSNRQLLEPGWFRHQ